MTPEEFAAAIEKLVTARASDKLADAIQALKEGLS
jgi:hypothetical protein